MKKHQILTSLDYKELALFLHIIEDFDSIKLYSVEPEQSKGAYLIVIFSGSHRDLFRAGRSFGIYKGMDIMRPST